ncbi:hypothetical protein CB0940_02076 [Cercospora beticola]|uniref:Zn(2)-C6 fungal-type domain-containing protein n=1 Tax=Cercospora beticola TaxID=122368 RepID=A0A2G5I9Y0_CERBT|nr:hypothetical protein CB0940_02076 [Cercospora beticola]PIB01598.1 hypothetical protein CB0940_02076 [Cercospora beticola]WPA97545.1 hypothetical protein RHO25_002155 [Cercospora beticola]CAK1353996.1 unnamed protein product [Cercospora beticola]
MSQGPADASESVSPTSNSAHHALNKLANGEHLKQKRARSQLSCIPCRQGKLKCNRSHDPACDQCIKRSREGQCHYVPPPKKQKANQNVKGRIRQLETLVVDLMNQQSQKQAQTQQAESTATTQSSATRTPSIESRQGAATQLTPPSDSDDYAPQDGHNGHGEAQDDVDSTTKPFGKLRISNGEISYVGETHWQAILNGISDLKRELGDEQDDEQAEGDSPERTVADVYGTTPMSQAASQNLAPDQTSSHLGLMLGGAGGAMTREQLIKAIPEKRITDRLCALWFNSPDPFKPIIHAPTFQDQYRNFWRDPRETPTMWIGLLFAILSLATSFGLRDADPDSDAAKRILAEMTKFHSLAGSAAVAADYTKGQAHTMECLMLFGAGMRSAEASVSAWLIIGLVVRLGLRMGYHRDSDNHPGISVFDGEMRRRIWSVISMIDVLFSFQLGMPGMVKRIQSDTRPPRNLLDRDFNVNTTVLPPDRSVDEITPSSYMRAKLGLVAVFAEVNELIHATVPPCHGQMMDLDRRLDEARAAMPPPLQMPDMSELVTEPAEQVMCRINLDLIYLKTKMVLHRRYMERPFAQLSVEEQQFGIGFSRRSCVDAALKVLRHQHEIYAASQPGGQLESVKWYMGSISTHDFLLAAMIVCLELSQQIGDNVAVLNPNLIMCPIRGVMMDALEKSHKIWSAAAAAGRKRDRNAPQQIGKEHMLDETEKACRAMSTMLTKVRARFPHQPDATRKTNMNCAAPSRPGMGIANDDLGIDFSLPQSVPAQTSKATHTAGGMPFGGIVSYHNWDDTADLGESLQYNAPHNANGNSQGPSVSFYMPHLSQERSLSSSEATGPMSTNQYTSSSGPNSNEPSPNSNSQDYSLLPEFGMIGDMLDMPGSIDWEMFDAGVIKNNNPTSLTHDAIMDNPMPGSAMNGPIDYGGANGGASSGPFGFSMGGDLMVAGGTNGVGNYTASNYYMQYGDDGFGTNGMGMG